MSTFTDFFNIGRSLGLEGQDVWDNFATERDKVQQDERPAESLAYNEKVEAETNS